MYQIGAVTKRTNVSADTLRYYEKIGLLPPISRNASGLRIYSEQDIARLRFIKRAQRMRFSLNEISKLLAFREDPQRVKPDVRRLAVEKLSEIDEQLKALNMLHGELQLLVNLCGSSAAGCPIIEEFDERTQGDFKQEVSHDSQ